MDQDGAQEVMVVMEVNIAQVPALLITLDKDIYSMEARTRGT